jgi:16S rRNA (adenine1518-N6/adenine1519-N6)-dimethyltransferase
VAIGRGRRTGQQAGVSVARIRERLERHGLHLSSDLGQNFMVHEAQAERLARLAGVEAADTVIEVGAGLGSLTRALAARAARVISIEIDSGLVRALESDGTLPPNVELIHGDALRIDLRALAGAAEAGVRVVANLPYSAASPLLRRLLDLRDLLLDWSVMLQRELAERLLAGPGSRQYGSLSVLHQLVAELQCAARLGPRSFFPVPRVDSWFLRVYPRSDSPLREGELEWAERVVRACFAKRRKTIANSLLGGGLPRSADRSQIGEALAAAGIDPGARAESLSPRQLLELARSLECARDVAESR